MHENDIKEKHREKPFLDSFKIGTAAKGGALSVYFDLADLDTTELKLKNFFKTKAFIQKLGGNIA